MEDDMKILWEHDGYRLIRVGDDSDSFTVFESALFSDDLTIIDWQEVTASQVGMLLSHLGEWFDFKDRGLEKFEIRRMALNG